MNQINHTKMAFSSIKMKAYIPKNDTHSQSEFVLDFTVRYWPGV